MAINKYLTNNGGTITELMAPASSVGAPDAGKIPSLNVSGILDSTIINSKTTSAGVGDSGKIAALNAQGFLDSTLVNSKQSSAGADDAGKVIALDSTGKLHSTMLPTGVGADTALIVTSEDLSGGDLVNIWNNSGVAKVRKADATTVGKEAHGFVLDSFTNTASATVYFEGTCTGLSGLVPGKQFLSLVAGTSTASAPTNANNIVQLVGFATSNTTLNFQSGAVIVLAADVLV